MTDPEQYAILYNNRYNIPHMLYGIHDLAGKIIYVYQTTDGALQIGYVKPSQLIPEVLDLYNDAIARGHSNCAMFHNNCINTVSPFVIQRDRSTPINNTLKNYIKKMSNADRKKLLSGKIILHFQYITGKVGIITE